MYMCTRMYVHIKSIQVERCIYSCNVHKQNKPIKSREEKQKCAYWIGENISQILKLLYGIFLQNIRIFFCFTLSFFEYSFITIDPSLYFTEFQIFNCI